MILARWFLAVSLTLAGLASATASSEPNFAGVFVSGTGGYHTYRIPAIILTSNRTLLAFCEGRKNGRGDTGRIDLLLKRSTDGGSSWSSAQVVWSDGENTCGNPAPVVDQTTGTVWLLMTWNLGRDNERAIERAESRDTRRVYVTRSTDDGLTWARPAEITAAVKKPAWRWYATGPVNGIQLTRDSHKGRLVIPANHSETNSLGQSVSRSHVIFSDDHGATWQLGGLEDERTNESTLVELSDGALMQNMRTYKGKNRRAVACSSDAGATWSPVKHDEALIEPVCQASILRATWPAAGEKSRILFSNPASLNRENLTVRLSFDEGTTWPHGRSIHSGPAAYSCLVMLPDKMVGCLFECGDMTPYEKISFARFPLSWLE
jgi:sialidase-1